MIRMIKTMMMMKKKNRMKVIKMMKNMKVMKMLKVMKRMKVTKMMMSCLIPIFFIVINHHPNLFLFYSLPLFSMRYITHFLFNSFNSSLTFL